MATLLVACAPSPTPDYSVAIPSAEDWNDCGPVFHAGMPGDWDHVLWGGFAASAVKRGDTFLLYYQGSDGYDSRGETVTRRAIGVATSRDGIRFQKHPDNPLIRFAPTRQPEEGAVSSAALVDEVGHVTLYYGANTWAGGQTVTADARRALSTDGIEFVDGGVVMSHRDEMVWGFGDEVFPVVAFQHDGRHFLYYVPSGSEKSGYLGVMWEDFPSRRRTSSAASRGGPIPVWGPGSAVRVGTEAYALFLSHNRPGNMYMEVRTVSPGSPEALSGPVHRYSWDNIVPRAVLLDHDSGVWYLYYRNVDPDRYGVMMAGRECSTDGGTPTKSADG